MILDIFLGGWLILSGLLGFKDGIVRKFISSAMSIVALVLGSMFMGEAAKVLVEKAAIDPADGPLYGYLIVFVGILVAQSLIYKFASGSYKIGGIADRIGGAAFGLVHGVLVLSALLYILAMSGWPSQSFKKDSRIYRSVVNIAPQILDTVLETGPGALDELKDMSIPEKPQTREPSAIESKGQTLRQRVQERSQQANKSIDSLRSSLRR